MEPSSSNFQGGLQHPLIWLGVIFGTLVTVYLVEAVWWLSLPLVIAVIICYLSRPLLVGLKRRGLSFQQSLLAYLVLGSGAILLLVLVAVPWLASGLSDLRGQLPLYWERIETLPLGVARELELVFPGFSDAGLVETVTRNLDRFEDLLLSDWLPAAAVMLLSTVPSLLLVPYLAFFILKDGARFKQLILRGVPNAYFEKVMLLFYNLDSQIKQYFRGLMAMTFLDTATLAAGLFLIGIPVGGIFGPGLALFLGLLSAVLAWIPYVGTAVACLVVVMVCLGLAPGNLLLVGAAVLLFVAVRVIDDFLYTPMTVGRSLNAHPLLTVMIIFAAGFIGGVFGLLLVMPILGLWMAFGEVFGQVWFDERLRARHLQSRRLRQIHARQGLDIS
jgi:predicted PurR-regulated permease PerM